MTKVKASEPSIKAQMIVNIYVQDPLNVRTHRPEITFSGELLSRKALEDIHHHSIKALNFHKVQLAKAEQRTNGELS